jgi:O-antigen/teichoic acid export membrane protein
VIKFLKIYFWQFVSLIVSFASFFVVTPYLSTAPSVFGIYSIVMSVCIFISYADLGFLSAGMKYACECYSQNDRELEVKILGFVGFIFLFFVGLFGITMIGISFDPSILVKNFANSDEIKIASRLLLILGLFAPVFVLQRMIQIFFAIRLEDYIYQRVLIFFNLIKIASVFFFFSNGKYLIVEYFLFTQVCSVLAVLTGLFFAKRKFDLNIKLLLSSFRFSQSIYQKTNKLAFSSLFVTFSWIIYYELDLLVIGKWMGPKFVAIYAIGLSMMSYFRTLFGIFYTPFTAKFNHFVGIGDHESLISYFNKILVIGFPLTVFSTLIIFLTSKSFIFSWVGPNYASSVPIAQTLVLCYLFGFISYPIGVLIMAYERYKALYIIYAILPVIFWVGVVSSKPYWGLQSFANFKFIAFLISIIFEFFVMVKYLKMNFFSFIKRTVYPGILPICFIVIATLLMKNYYPFEKSKLNLAMYFAMDGVVFLFAGLIFYFSSQTFKQFLHKLLVELKLFKN